MTFSLPFSGARRLEYHQNRLTLNSLSPAQAVQNTTVTLGCLGANFNGACVVYYDGVAKATTFVSTSEITASVAVGATGAHTVEVRDPATARKSLPVTFTATAT